MKLSTAILIFTLMTSSSAVLSQEAIPYTITLGNQSSNVGRCAVNLKIDGIGDIDIVASAPNYVVNFSVPANQNKNHLVKVKGTIKWGVPPNNAPACSVNGEILINQLILDEWKPIKEKLAGSESLRCINLGFAKMNATFDGPASSEKIFLRPTDGITKKIFETCDQLLVEPLKKNISCDLVDSKTKSLCDEDYYSTVNPNRKLKLQEALNAALDGQQIKRGLWETTSAQASRAEQRRQQEEEQMKITKQREEREAWLKTAEGRKFVADEEAKRKKAEEEQLRAEAAKKAELEKQRAEEKAKEALLRQQCEKMKNWASDSRELIAKAFKTSVSSISLIRFEMGRYSCLAIVDTPKGPEKCSVRGILQDKKSGEYYADMGGPFAIQAVCGGLAY